MNNNKNEKGFTLIELLAVIIVLGIVGMIAVGVVSNSINSSKKKTFEINVNNLLDAAKDYVTKYMENNDFPEDGIEATSESLEIKNNPFISGIIKRNEEGKIVLIDVSDGTYCANGTKSNMEIKEESCETIDDTPPTLKIKELKTTRNSSKIMIKTQDSGSGIKEYKYCIKKESEENYKEEDCKLVEKNLEKGIVKEIKTLENLEPNTTYEIEVTSKNGSNNEKNEETKKITIKTKEIEEPTFKISTTTYALTKKLTIIYPEVDGGYQKYYQIDKETPIEVFENEIELDQEENVKIRAYITKEEKEIISNEIIITGLDQEGPSVNVTIPDLDKWTKEKEMTISAKDEGVGLALKPYINNGFGEKYKIWNRENSVILKSSGELNIKVRDRLGNVNQTFYLNGTECNVDTEDLCGINKIDSVAPKIEIKVIEGTTINNEKYKEWYNSDSVKVQIKITDYYLYNNEKIIGGSGVDLNKIYITAPFEETIIAQSATNYQVIGYDNLGKEIRQYYVISDTVFNDGTGIIRNNIINQNTNTTLNAICAKGTNNYKSLKNMMNTSILGQRFDTCGYGEDSKTAYDIENLTYKGTENDGKTYVYELELNTSGENKIKVSVSDKVGNIGTKEKTVKIDNIVPLIKAKSNPLSLGNVDYKFTDNLNVTYGPTGGIAECDPATSLKTGTYTVKCKATGNNGKVATDATGLSFEVRHSYPGTPKTHSYSCPYKCGTIDCDCSEVDSCGHCVNDHWDCCSSVSGNCNGCCVEGTHCKKETVCKSTCPKYCDKTCYKTYYTCPDGGTLGDGTTGKESKTTCYY